MREGRPGYYATPGSAGSGARGARARPFPHNLGAGPPVVAGLGAHKLEYIAKASRTAVRNGTLPWRSAMRAAPAKEGRLRPISPDQ